MTTTNEDAGLLTDEQILTIARHHFKEGANTTPSTLSAYCDSVRAIITSYGLAPSNVQVEAVRAPDGDDVESDGRLPALASTPEGKRLYSMAYARGRARERLNASGRLRASSRPAPAEELTRQEMRLMLPEGGYVNLFWPDELTAESAHMLSEMFSTIMQAFARAASSKAPDAAAASGGEKEAGS